MTVADVGAFPVYSGDPWAQGFAFGPEDAPEDVSGVTWLCHWRKTAQSTEFLELVVDDSDAANGNIVITATGEQTRAMGAGGVFDVQGGEVTRLRGRTTWKLDVTRD